MAARLVLLDRDGVLNVDRTDFVKRPEELELLPGAAAAVARLNRAGHAVVLCTNQSGVGRGLMTADMLAEVHRCLEERLAAAGARLDAIFACTDPPWAASERRKPAPGMLREAIARFAARAEETPMVGDALRDLQAAARLGCPRHLVLTGQGAATLAAGWPGDVAPVAVHADLAAAVETLLAAAELPHSGTS